MGTIRAAPVPRQGEVARIGLNLNRLGREPYSAVGIMADNLRPGRIERKTGWLQGAYTSRSRRAYLKWLPAPMKKSMGIESRKFTRDANKAVRPHCAMSAGAGVPCAAAVTAAMIFF